MSYVSLKKVNKANRSKDVMPLEKRKEIMFFLKEFKMHESLKPTFDINEEDDSKRFENQMNIQRWAARYGVLVRKLDELGYEFKKPTESTAKQSLIEGRSARQEFAETGRIKIGEVQLVPSVKQEDKEL